MQRRSRVREEASVDQNTTFQEATIDPRGQRTRSRTLHLEAVITEKNVVDNKWSSFTLLVYIWTMNLWTNAALLTLV